MKRGSAAAFDNVMPSPITPVMIDKDNTKNTHKRGSRTKEIKITYVNEIQSGVLEKALADIYADKVKNGTLAI